MPKNIVICSDGTGNAGIKKRGTNVYKLFEAVDVHRTSEAKIRQFKVYDDGVGTHRLKVLKAAGLAVGFGLQRNVFELYEAVARAYKPGDQIYMFGFSRGAFTVRLLAGFIAQCGIPKVDGASAISLRKTTKQAWTAYRHKYAATLERWIWRKRPDKAQSEVEEYIKEFQPHLPQIRFIGVWDTVDAYGIPFDFVAWLINTFIFRYTFEGRELSGKVDYGRHALAIDDERKTFHPTLWKDDPERIRQVWFPGAHADVGGGYPKQGLSLLALRWMVEEVNSITKDIKIPESANPEEVEVLKLQQAGLQWIPADTTYFETHSNSDDVYHNSRGGLAVFYRYRPRRIHKICNDAKNGIKIDAVIHDSALRRIQSRTYGYAPRAIPMQFKKEVTGQSDSPSDVDLGNGSSAYDLSAKYIKGRFLVQYLLYIATALFAGLVVTLGSSSSEEIEHGVHLFKKLFSPSGIFELVTNAYKDQPYLMGILTVVFTLILLASILLRLKIGSVCKRFWDQHRSTIY